MEKVKTLDFSEMIAASDLKVGRCRQLTEFMKVCEYIRSRSFLYHIFFRFCMFCALLGQDIRFSHVGTEPPLPGYYQYLSGVNVPCSRTQHGLTRVELEPPTSRSGVRGINHQATVLPYTF